MNGQPSLSTEALAARLIATGRLVAADLRVEGLAKLCLDSQRVSLALQKLEQGQAFDPAIAPSLRAMRATVMWQRDAEVIGHVASFEGIFDPEGDDLGFIVERRVLSERGKKLQEALDSIDQLLRMQRDLHDQLAAQRYASENLSRHRLTTRRG